MDDPDSEETRSLVTRLKGGNRDALGPLLAKHAPYLRSIIRARLGARIRRRVGVSDVVQIAQLDALEQVKDFVETDHLPFRWWLRKSAQRSLQRVLEQHLDAQKRDVRREIPLPDKSSLCLVAGLASGSPSPSQHVINREQAERVRCALAQLPDADREVLLMRTVERLPYDEIGYILGIDPAAARKRRGRALLRLDRLLRDQGFTESNL